MRARLYAQSIPGARRSLLRAASVQPCPVPQLRVLRALRQCAAWHRDFWAAHLSTIARDAVGLAALTVGTSRDGRSVRTQSRSSCARRPRPW